MFLRYFLVAKIITKNDGGVFNKLVTLVNQQRSFAFKPTAVLFKSKKKKNKQLQIDQLTNALTKTTTQLATQIETIQHNQQEKQLQQQELNDNPKVESSPQTSLDPLIDLPFLPSSLNYSLNNSNLASIKRLIKLSKPDSTIDDGSNNWTFFETGLFWFKDELHQFDKELNFDTITNTDGLTSYITDKILELEIQIGEQLEKKSNGNDNYVVNENYFINLIKLIRYKELFTILEKLKDNESLSLLKQFKNIIKLSKYQYYRYLSINEFLSNNGKTGYSNLDDLSMDEFYYYLISTNTINITQTDNYYKICPKLYQISQSSIFPSNIIAKQLLEMITELKLRYGKDETIMPWQKVKKQKISLLPLPIYHITNDSINNYIFSFLVLVEFDNFEILMDDACFGDIYKFKQAFGLTLVEPSKKTMLYIILQDQKRIRELFNDPRIFESYRELLSKQN